MMIEVMQVVDGSLSLFLVMRLYCLAEGVFETIELLYNHACTSYFVVWADSATHTLALTA
jgi:hypothetical protein